MSIQSSDVLQVLKTRYPQNVVEDLFYRDNPLLAILPKEDDFTGIDMTTTIQFGNGGARSALFATAQTLAGDAVAGHNAYGAFTGMTRRRDYGVRQISSELIQASRDNPGAFVREREREIDGMFNQLGRSLAISLYRNGGGTVGQLVEVTGTTVTLVNPEDITNFELGEYIQLASASTGGTLRGAGIAARIVTVNRATGVMTISIDLAGFTGITTLDYIVKQGDYDAKMYGLESYITTSTTPGTFLNLNRNQDVYRLSGVKKAIGAQPIEEGMIDAIADLVREGSNPDYCFLPWLQWKNLEKSLGSKLITEDFKVGEVGFRALMMNVPGKSPLKVVADVNCPSNRGYILQSDTWKIHHLGALPHIIAYGGKQENMIYNDDGIEIRAAYRGNLTCTAPGYNLGFTFT